MFILLSVTTLFASSWSLYQKPPEDTRHRPRLNFLPKIITEVESQNFFRTPTLKNYEKPKFTETNRVPNENYDILKFGMANWLPKFKFDKARFEKLNSLKPIVHNHDEDDSDSNEDFYDKTKFEKVSGAIDFLKNLDMRPQEIYDLNNLKCQYRNRNGDCVSYIKKKQNIATVSPLENVNNLEGDILRTPYKYYSDERYDYDDDSMSSERHEDLTRISKKEIKTLGTVSDDYIDASTKLVVREQNKPKAEDYPDFLTTELLKELNDEINNALQKQPNAVGRKSFKHKKRKNQFMRTPKKSDLNITFTPLKFYRADSDEDDSDSSSEENTVKKIQSKSSKKDSDSGSSEEDDSSSSENKGKKKKRNRFSVIDNEKKKGKKKINRKEKNNSSEKKLLSLTEVEKKRNVDKYNSDESFGSSEKLSSETHDQTKEYTTRRPKKKKKKKSSVYMYMQGPHRLYTDSEEETRRDVKIIDNINKDIEALRYRAQELDSKKNYLNDKQSVSEDYIDIMNYRRKLPTFLPKRYFWKKDELPDLGYYWFDGPQGYTPGPYQINY